MAKRNKKGKTWKQHASPYLSKALKTASSSWKPKSERTNMSKVVKLRNDRLKINREIKKELDK
jgi:hypothetical protein